MGAITLKKWRAAAEAHSYGEVERLISAVKVAASEECVHPWHDCAGCDAPLLDVAICWRMEIEVEPETWVAAIIGDQDLCDGCIQNVDDFRVER